MRLPLALVLCASFLVGSAANAVSAAPKAAPTTITIVISDHKYVGTPTSVPVGAMVVWKNTDNTWHSATADDGSFDTGRIDAGTSSKPIAFNAKGSFTYSCMHH